MESINRIAQAWIDAGLWVKEFAAKLGVDAATVSNWEAGRRQLTLERLIEIAGLLGVGITYLLGLDEQVSYTEPTEMATLPVLHRMPVWIKSRDWALVDAIKQWLMFTDGETMPFDAIQKPIYLTPPAFAFSFRGINPPLGFDDIIIRDCVWG